MSAVSAAHLHSDTEASIMVGMKKKCFLLLFLLPTVIAFFSGCTIFSGSTFESVAEADELTSDDEGDGGDEGEGVNTTVISGRAIPPSAFSLPSGYKKVPVSKIWGGNP